MKQRLNEINQRAISSTQQNYAQQLQTANNRESKVIVQKQNPKYSQSHSQICNMSPKAVDNTDMTYQKENSISEANQFNNENLIIMSPPTSRDTVLTDHNPFKSLKQFNNQSLIIQSPKSFRSNYFSQTKLEKVVQMSAESSQKKLIMSDTKRSLDFKTNQQEHIKNLISLKHLGQMSLNKNITTQKLSSNRTNQKNRDEDISMQQQNTHESNKKLNRGLQKNQTLIQVTQSIKFDEDKINLNLLENTIENMNNSKQEEDSKFRQKNNTSNFRYLDLKIAQNEIAYKPPIVEKDCFSAFSIQPIPKNDSKMIKKYFGDKLSIQQLKIIRKLKDQKLFLGPIFNIKHEYSHASQDKNFKSLNTFEKVDSLLNLNHNQSSSQRQIANNEEANNNQRAFDKNFTSFNDSPNQNHLFQKNQFMQQDTLALLHRKTEGAETYKMNQFNNSPSFNRKNSQQNNFKKDMHPSILDINKKNSEHQGLSITENGESLNDGQEGSKYNFYQVKSNQANRLEQVNIHSNEFYINDCNDFQQEKIFDQRFYRQRDCSPNGSMRYNQAPISSNLQNDFSKTELEYQNQFDTSNNQGNSFKQQSNIQNQNLINIQDDSNITNIQYQQIDLIEKLKLNSQEGKYRSKVQRQIVHRNTLVGNQIEAIVPKSSNDENSNLDYVQLDQDNDQVRTNSPPGSPQRIEIIKSQIIKAEVSQKIIQSKQPTNLIYPANTSSPLNLQTQGEGHRKVSRSYNFQRTSFLGNFNFQKINVEKLNKKKVSSSLDFQKLKTKQEEMGVQGTKVIVGEQIFKKPQKVQKTTGIMVTNAINTSPVGFSSIQKSILINDDQSPFANAELNNAQQATKPQANNNEIQKGSQSRIVESKIPKTNVNNDIMNEIYKKQQTGPKQNINLKKRIKREYNNSFQGSRRSSAANMRLKLLEFENFAQNSGVSIQEKQEETRSASLYKQKLGKDKENQKSSNICTITINTTNVDINDKKLRPLTTTGHNKNGFSVMKKPLQHQFESSLKTITQSNYILRQKLLSSTNQIRQKNEKIGEGQKQGRKIKNRKLNLLEINAKKCVQTINPKLQQKELQINKNNLQQQLKDIQDYVHGYVTFDNNGINQSQLIHSVLSPVSINTNIYKNERLQVIISPNNQKLAQSQVQHNDQSSITSHSNHITSQNKNTKDNESKFNQQHFLRTQHVSLKNKVLRPYQKFTDKINNRYLVNKQVSDKSTNLTGLTNVILSQQQKVRSEIEDRIFKIPGPSINFEKENAHSRSNLIQKGTCVTCSNEISNERILSQRKNDNHIKIKSKLYPKVKSVQQQAKHQADIRREKYVQETRKIAYGQKLIKMKKMYNKISENSQDQASRNNVVDTSKIQSKIQDDILDQILRMTPNMFQNQQQFDKSIISKNLIIQPLKIEQLVKNLQNKNQKQQDVKSNQLSNAVSFSALISPEEQMIQIETRPKFNQNQSNDFKQKKKCMQLSRVSPTPVETSIKDDDFNQMINQNMSGNSQLRQKLKSAVGVHFETFAEIINSQKGDKSQKVERCVASSHGFMKGKNPKSFILQSMSLKKIKHQMKKQKEQEQEQQDKINLHKIQDNHSRYKSSLNQGSLVSQEKEFVDLAEFIQAQSLSLNTKIIRTMSPQTQNNESLFSGHIIKCNINDERKNVLNQNDSTFQENQNSLSNAISQKNRNAQQQDLSNTQNEKSKQNEDINHMIQQRTVHKGYSIKQDSFIEKQKQTAPEGQDANNELRPIMCPVH